MKQRVATTALAGALLALPLTALCQGRERSEAGSGISLLGEATNRSEAEIGRLGEEPAVFRDAARAAWEYVEAQTEATGLINSVADYEYATTWDIASGLAAVFSAHHLGLIGEAEFDRRIGAILETLERMELFDGGAFNKNYHTDTGRPAGRSNREPDVGYGWSVTDLGRLLVWLRIIARNHPEHADEAEDVVERLDFGRLVEGGYLRGASNNRNGRLWAYQEGRLGYEQYAARGFAIWGADPANALDLMKHARPIQVLGHPLVYDERGSGHLTSEPLILMGLELGWTPDVRQLAWRLLAAQEERFERTNQITILSEDAINQTPHYFYYYSIYEDGEFFVVGAQGTDEKLDAPRWVSAKAAFAWHALLPSEYTWKAVNAVLPARSSRGWNSGVYEGSGKPTCCENVNTAGIILESALYAGTGRPLLYTVPDG